MQVLWKTRGTCFVLFFKHILTATNWKKERDTKYFTWYQKNFTFCFSKNLIWRKPQVYTFIVLYFWRFCFGSLTVAGKMHLIPIWGLFFCDIFKTPSTPHPSSFCSSMARVWELAAEQVGKTHSRGNIGEKIWKKKYWWVEKRWREDWKANVILSPVTNYIYILDGLPVHTQYFAGARNKMQTLQKSRSCEGRHKPPFSKLSHKCLFKQSLNGYFNNCI